uniref:Piwi domain-containing protein n=1 Tax=Panagrolaimus sp. ES5 TaxID=591445 RepID=A0AC34GCK1_9BILA
MVVAGYLLYNTNLRVKDANGYRFVGLPSGPPSKGLPTPSTLKERAELVFQLIPEKMKNLVIVDSTLSNFEMIQACVEVAEKYAKNVMVIPSLLARLTYAMEHMKVPPMNEVILIVTITSVFVEFVILLRDRAGKLYISECKNYESNQCLKMFGKYLKQNNPTSTIFVFHKNFSDIVEKVVQRFKPQNCQKRSYEKWDYVLLFGAMVRAMDDEDGFDTRYHIANFSHGFET